MVLRSTSGRGRESRIFSRGIPLGTSIGARPHEHPQNQDRSPKWGKSINRGHELSPCARPCHRVLVEVSEDHSGPAQNVKPALLKFRIKPAEAGNSAGSPAFGGRHLAPTKLQDIAAAAESMAHRGDIAFVRDHSKIDWHTGARN